MKVNWLLETDAFEDNIEGLKAEIVRQGMTHKTARYRPFGAELDYLNLFDQKDCVIFYGSLNFGTRVRKESPWVPGIYCNFPVFDCSQYYTYFGSNLLNKNFFFMPYGSLLPQKDKIYEYVGREDAIFIRPNSGSKLFHGQLVYKEEFEKAVDKMTFYGIRPDDFCVIAEPQKIEAEWRFVVVKNKVVAGSRYRTNGRLDIRPFDLNEQNVWDYADKMAKLYTPDAAWTLDICRSQDDLHVLEIGSFSCAGLYNCDLEAVVREVSKAALADWEDLYVR